MELSCEIIDKKFNDRMNEIHDALIGQGRSGDAATVVQDEARLFLKQVINLTPPPGLGTAAKKQGEAAIGRDLMKIFTPVNEELMNTVALVHHGTTGIDAWFETAGKPMHVQWDRIDPSGAGMKAWHNQNRDSRGRTRELKRGRGTAWYAPYVVRREDFAAYRDRIVSHVGRRKAAWAKSFVELGGKVQGWIDRHVSGARGLIINNLDVKNHPSVTMINSSVGISGDAHIVQSALRIRYEAMGRKLRLIVSGYASDVARGIKVTNKAHRTEAGSV